MSKREPPPPEPNPAAPAAVIGLAVVSSTVVFYEGPELLWIPAAALLLSGVTYAGAIAAAVSYNTLLRTAYDLHRFDMLTALHYELPIAEQEHGLFRQISALFRATDQYQSMKGDEEAGIAHELVEWRYDHGGREGD